MSTPTILYVQLVNGDPVWDYSAQLTDVDAVAQAILTRLKLNAGEWWENTNDGLPLWQSILGQSASPHAQQQIATLISAVILGTPFVIGLTNVQTTYTPQTRAYSYSAVVNTTFGTVAVSYPQAPSGALPQ